MENPEQPAQRAHLVPDEGWSGRADFRARPAIARGGEGRRSSRSRRVRADATRALAICAAAIALGLITPLAVRAAESSYPVKPVRMIVPFSPGASTDIVTRLLAQKLAESTGQQFIVDNRAGAAGAVGAELVARAEPDGYTLLVTNPGPSLNAILLRRRPTYGFADFTPVIYVASAPVILVANPKFPPGNVKELIAYAKANPGKVSWGSSGINSNPHVALEVLKSVTGVDIVHVPYKGSAPALTDVIGGQIQGLYTTTATAEAAIRSGRAKVLGIAGPRRSPVVPDVPTLAEQGIDGADNLLWMGVVTTARVPRAIVDKLNREINRLLQTAEVRQRFEQLGLDVEGGTPKHFAAFVQTQAKVLGALIKRGVLQPE
jgi:tripartite-type tricarboxylate transporter receptor subunit TctC